ncbi:hypothetical protein Kpho01_53010 [Kitasatospora phosalacinea]|uniref:Uncharacterized protein n=1 Tax=Kitasatospora phosalacinea TaxID=2065 RepID=A0A9W6PJA8_9ACTN|nr:hypothetical protein Kpho01_53010 [Kitasatospora phosalacinea]
MPRPVGGDQVAVPGERGLRRAPLPLAEQLRLEGALAVAGDVDPNRADLGQHGLRANAVARVPATGPGRVVLLVAETVRQLAFGGGLQELLRELLEQASGAGELQPARADPVDQLPDQLVVQGVRLQLHRPYGLHGLGRDGHVRRQVLLP